MVQNPRRHRREPGINDAGGLHHSNDGDDRIEKNGRRNVGSSIHDGHRRNQHRHFVFGHRGGDVEFLSRRLRGSKLRPQRRLVVEQRIRYINSRLYARLTKPETHGNIDLRYGRRRTNVRSDGQGGQRGCHWSGGHNGHHGKQRLGRCIDNFASQRTHEGVLGTPEQLDWSRTKGPE